jgi:hypothetical protein
MNNRNWVESTILGTIVLNILVLIFVFLIPRVQFMAGHWEWKAEALMESLGARDTPNQYSETYKIANQLRKIAKEDAIIYMPTNKWEFEFNKSVVIQKLYPRKVYFSEDSEADDVFSEASNISNSYVVFNERWGQDLCAMQSVKYFKTTGIGICRVGK